MVLVPIPWQPHHVVTETMLARLVRASAIRGRNIQLNDQRSPTGRFLAAWRALEEQIYLWDLFRAGRGNPASNPYTGQRNHLRGAAVDILNKSDRPAMLAAGFTPEPTEWWHFNDPNWRAMPIIAINAETAGNGTTPISDPNRNNDMPYLLRTVQHGIYTVSPGVVICHLDSKVVDGVGFRDWGTIMDIAPDDLAKFLFALGGCPKSSIPAPGKVWYGASSARA
jgi:hypothetical protein